MINMSNKTLGYGFLKIGKLTVFRDKRGIANV
jgi:hypothetical protein